MGRFNFKGSDQQKLVRDLSGGNVTVFIWLSYSKGANFLLLDEPTNDLDVETLRALESAIETFPGSMMIISHDRWFLDRIVTHILAFEGDSRTVFFEGNYSEYEADRKKRMGGEATPTRVRYKRLAYIRAWALKRCPRWLANAASVFQISLHPILNQLHGIAQVLNGVNAHLADLLFWQIGFRH